MLCNLHEFNLVTYITFHIRSASRTRTQTQCSTTRSEHCSSSKHCKISLLRQQWNAVRRAQFESLLELTVRTYWWPEQMHQLFLHQTRINFYTIFLILIYSTTAVACSWQWVIATITANLTQHQLVCTLVKQILDK